MGNSNPRDAFLNTLEYTSTNSRGYSEIAEYWKFPIKNEIDYKGRITFKAYKEEHQTIGQLAGTVVDEVVDLRGDPALAAAANDAAARAMFVGSTSYLKTAQPIGPIKHNAGTVSLYLPTAIQIADSLEYANVDLGTIGGLAAAGMQKGGRLNAKAFLGDAFDKLLEDGSTLWDMMKSGGTSEGGQIAALKLARGMNSEVAGAIETTTGIAINPNRRSTFRGVGIRRFQFTFKLQPTSPKEASAIRGIIKFFRKEMYPITKAALLGDRVLSAAYEFPSKFEIRMNYGGYKVATGLLPCFLENVNVVYNQQAMSFHKDGEPQSTDITLSFMEERALSRSDIEGGL